MKKKHKSPSVSKVDLESESAVIHSHSLFFDRLIELIPARFYLPTADTEKPWFGGLTKKQKTSMKQKSRENTKKARRDRLDPGKSASTTLDLLKERLESEKSSNPAVSKETSDRATTYGELRERLHKRLEEFRSGRKGSDTFGKRERSERRDDNNKARKKQKGDDGSKSAEESASRAARELAFGKLKVDGGAEKAKKRVSKGRELEKARRLGEAKKGGKIGWEVATDRASGVKVHDNPKLLKQSMHKGKRRQEKSAEKWRERVRSMEKSREERQRTRGENIAGRVHEKKMIRIAKREKKLMRPGFEGRRDTYINADRS